MPYEKSCGGVVYTRQDNEILYVIIRHLGGHCGFPKGHMEPGEDEYATALREIREEVGLTCALIEGFRMSEEYPLPNKPNVVKEVIYFLAEYFDQELVCQTEEVSAVYLLPYEKAVDILTFSETKQILTEADRFLKS